LSTLDWTILIVYCAAILGVGLYFRDRASRGVEDFFVAGRDLPWWVIGFADVASYTGGGQAFVMMFFLSGFGGLWLMAWVTWAIWMPLVAVLWAPMWSRLGVVTSGEFIQRRYAGKRASLYRNVYGVYASIFWGLTTLAYVSAWMAAATSPILGWSNARVLIVFGGVTIAYSLLSGLFAVAYNDLLQFLVLMVGNTVFAWLLLGKAGGYAHALHRAEALRGAQFLQTLPTGGAIGAATMIALCVQGLFFAGSPFAGEGWTAQRYMAARSELHAVLGQMLNGVLALVVRLIPFLLIGLAAASLYTPAQVPAAASLWSDLVRRHAPPGLFGLLLVCSIAGYMASIAAIGNWAASYLVNDLYCPRLRPKAGEKEVIRASRLISALLLIVAFIWGATIQPKELERWVLFINSALAVFPLPLAWLKWFWWRTNLVGDMLGILGAFPAGYLVWFGSDAVLPRALRRWFHGVLGWNLENLVPAFSDLDKYPFWMGFSILFGLGWLFILAGTLLTRPEPPEILKEFYLKVRPIGWWGPVRQALAQEEDSALHLEVRNNLTACVWGVVFYGALILAFFSTIGGKFSQALIIGAAALLFGMLFVRSALAR
jgi:Na+/proline symporter